MGVRDRVLDMLAKGSVRANEVIGGGIKGVHIGPGFARGKAIAAEMGSMMRKDMMSASRKWLPNGGMGLELGLAAGVGGGAGYFLGDGDTGSVIKGAGLGVLGAVGHRAFRAGRASGALRGGISDAKAFAKGRYGAIKSDLRNRYFNGLGEGYMRNLGLEPLDPGGQMRLAFNAPVPAGPAEAAAGQMSLF